LTPSNAPARRASWLVPVVGVSLIAAATAYVAGLGAARRLAPAHHVCWPH
jgi:hypothetical protein